MPSRVSSNAAGAAAHAQQPAALAPSVAPLDPSPDSIRFSAVDVWPHPRDDNCFHHAVGADATKHGATCALDQASLRRLVKTGCNSAQAHEYRMGDGELLSTTLALENNRTLQWLGKRALKKGSSGWASVEEAVVLANQLKMLINIYEKRSRCYALRAVARPVRGVPIGTINLLYVDECHYERLVPRSSASAAVPAAAAQPRRHAAAPPPPPPVPPPPKQPPPREQRNRKPKSAYTPPSNTRRAPTANMFEALATPSGGDELSGDEFDGEIESRMHSDQGVLSAAQMVRLPIR